MKKFDTKVQMMDAGMTLFETEENYGNTLGQVKAELEVYGKVLRPSELSEAILPDSTGDCDLFLDWSSAWRKRYISCHLESAGETEKYGKTIYRYAASFKEGNRSTILRGAVMLMFLLTMLTEIFFGSSLLSKIQGLVCAGLTAWLWILPSRKAQNLVFSLMRKLKDDNRRQ